MELFLVLCINSLMLCTKNSIKIFAFTCSKPSHFILTQDLLNNKDVVALFWKISSIRIHKIIYFFKLFCNLQLKLVLL